MSADQSTHTELDGLRDISRRARIAYALCCLERVTDTHHLDGDAWQDWRERAWRMTSAPKDQWQTRSWPASFAEIDALFAKPVGGWGEGLADLLRRVFALAKDTCDRAIEGLADSDAVRALGRELIAQQIEPPPIERFRRSPAHEMGGIGRSAPPGFYRLGVEREDFVWHLLAELRSTSIHRNRGAAFALSHLGLASTSFVAPLVEYAVAGDADLAGLARSALERVSSVEEWEPVVQARTSEEIEKQSDLEREKLERLLLPLITHPESSIRARAARKLVSAGAEHAKSAAVANALAEGLADSDPDTRREVARLLRHAGDGFVAAPIFRAVYQSGNHDDVVAGAAEALLFIHGPHLAGEIAGFLVREPEEPCASAVVVLRRLVMLRRSVRIGLNDIAQRESALEARAREMIGRLRFDEGD